MMNMTFPLSYRFFFFFYFCHGEGRNFVSFVFDKVASVLTRLKVSVCACVCALSTVLGHVRTRATGAYKR